MEQTKTQKKFSEWYEKNAEERNAKRRAKYRKDKEFRDSEKARVQAYRSKTSVGNQKTYRTLNGESVEVVRIGKAAQLAGTTREIIRRYESEGLIPISTWHDEPQRLYTLAQCKLIKKLADFRRQTRAPADHLKVVRLVARIFERWNDK